MKYNNLLKREGIKEGEKLNRAFVCDQIKSINKEERLIDFTISTDRVDRYGDIVSVSGWELKEYKKNPVVLFGHNSRTPPIGKATKVWKDDALHATAKFMSEDISPFAYSIFRMFEEKFLKAVSVGFIPLKYEEIKDEKGDWTGGFKFLKQELLEFSAVPIPANPDALMDAKSKGIDLNPFRDWASHELDVWNPELEKLYKNDFGVSKKDLENVYRKAAGVGTIYKTPLQIQDELLRKNLEAAKKAKELNKVEETEVTDSETDGRVIFKIGENDEFSLPMLDSKELSDLNVGQTVISTEKINDNTTLSIENADDISAFSYEILNELNSDGFVSIDNTGEEPKLSVYGSNKCVVYTLFGADEEKQVAIGKLTSVIDKPLAPLRGKDLPETVSIPKSTDPVIEDLEVTEPHEEEIEPEVDSSEEIEAKSKDKDELPVEVDVKIKDEVVDEVDEDVDEDEEVTLSTQLSIFEHVFNDFEEVLDNSIKNGYSFRQHEIRKIKFLVGLMNDICIKLDLDTDKETKKVEPKAIKTSNMTESDLDNILAQRVASLGPVITSIVERELRKAKGRLD